MRKQEMAVENRSGESHGQHSPRAGTAEAAVTSHGPSQEGSPTQGLLRG